MAINVYCGVMGSGKSYEVVSGPILDAVAAGRRVVTNIDGIDEGRMHEYLHEKRGVPMDRLGRVVHVTNERISQDGFFPVEAEKDGATVVTDGIVCAGDLVAIDEAWRMWGQDCGKLKAEHMAFFRMHRHFTHAVTGVACDVVLMIQDIGGLHRSLKAVVELSFRMHKLKSLGMSRRYRVEMYEGYKQTSKTRAAYFVRTYRSEIFPLYQSYAGGAGAEAVVDKRQNIFLRGKVWVMALGVVCFWIVGGIVLWRFFHPAQKPTRGGASLAIAASGVGGASAVRVEQGGGVRPVGVASAAWRVAGRLSYGGVLWVVLADADGRLRVEPFSGFSGNGAMTSGTVDGSRAAVWSGAVAQAGGVVK